MPDTQKSCVDCSQIWRVKAIFPTLAKTPTQLTGSLRWLRCQTSPRNSEVSKLSRTWFDGSGASKLSLQMIGPGTTFSLDSPKARLSPSCSTRSRRLLMRWARRLRVWSMERQMAASFVTSTTVSTVRMHPRHSTLQSQVDQSECRITKKLRLLLTCLQINSLSQLLVFLKFY